MAGYWNAHSDRDWEDSCGMHEPPPTDDDLIEQWRPEAPRPDMRHYAVVDGAGIAAAPFAPGQRIYSRASPEHGSLIASAIGLFDPRDPTSGWVVQAGGHRGAFFTIAPASHFASCPPDWTEPPPQPARAVRLGLSEADRQAALAEDDNPVYRAEFETWERAMREWTDRLNRGRA